jgi:hypothetical protein
MRILIGLVAMIGLAGCTKQDSDTEVPLTYKLTFSGVGYEAHNDQKLAAVVEDSDGKPTAGGEQDATVANGTFQFTFQPLEVGDYQLFWYADLSGDGTCQAPPADHAWSHSFTVSTTDVIFEHVHGTDFNPAACAEFP